MTNSVTTNGERPDGCDGTPPTRTTPRAGAGDDQSSLSHNAAPVVQHLINRFSWPLASTHVFFSHGHAGADMQPWLRREITLHGRWSCHLDLFGWAVLLADRMMCRCPCAADGLMGWSCCCRC
jgi:hypothetical protein